MSTKSDYTKLVNDKGLGEGVHIFQGNNHLKTVSGSSVYGADWIKGEIDVSTGIQSLFDQVAWVYAAIRTRKSFMRQINTGFYSGGERVKGKIFAGIPLSDLPRIDQAIELHGGAYYIKENTLGSTVVFDWLDPNYITPDTTSAYRGGYKTYHYGNPDSKQVHNTIPEDKLLIIQERGMSEQRGMTSAGNAVFASGSILRGITQTFKAFYETNGLPLIAVIVKGETTQDQADAIKTRFARLFSGRQTNANKVAGLAGDIEIVKISFSPDELNNTEMSEQEIKTVLATFEIHPSLLLTSANKAETEYRIKNLLTTLDARLNLIADSIEGDKDWQRYANVTIETQLSKHPLFQAENLEQAAAISALTGTPILTVNEGRDMLELEPIVGGDVLVGFQEEVVVTNEVVIEETKNIAPKEIKSLEWKEEASVFNRWLKRRENPDIDSFKSIHLTHDDKLKMFADYVMAIKLTEQEEEDLFLLVERDELEAKHADLILEALEDQLAQLEADPESELETEKLLTAILALLLAANKLGVESLQLQIDDTVNETDALDIALIEAEAQSVTALEQINKSTSDKIAEFILAGLTGAALLEALKPLFDKTRAELISNDQGSHGFNQGVQGAGEVAGITEWEFYTMLDDTVCPSCAPLHGITRASDAFYLYEGALYILPIHPGCRCANKPVTT